MDTAKRDCGNPPTVDYEAANVACAGFDLRGVVSPERVGRLASMVRRLVRNESTRPAKLLDIGCGTGRFAIPLACVLNDFEVTGADASEKMLEQARAKPQSDRVRWSKEDINDQSFGSETFDLIFVSDVLHHIADPVAALRECLRVLRPGGWLLVKYGAMENIARDPEHTFFPGTVYIDATRTPTEEMMTGWLAQAGFGRISSQLQVERTRQSAICRLEAARAKSISVLHLITNEQFDKGLQLLSEHVVEHPDDEWLLVDPTTWTWGQRTA